MAVIEKSLGELNISPIVYSYIDGKEQFSFRPERITPAMTQYVHSRKNDFRKNPLNADEKLFQGNVFYFTCIGKEEDLLPAYKKLAGSYNCLYSKDIYDSQQWLEIMPKQVSKANAALQLKKHLLCEKIISFGDGINDISMFEISDECYAVENAMAELKQIATAVIPGNNEDGVAKWLAQNVK